MYQCMVQNDTMVLLCSMEGHLMFTWMKILYLYYLLKLSQVLQHTTIYIC